MDRLRWFWSYILLLVCIATSIANSLDLPTKSIRGKDYYYYQVQPKETIYTVSHKLGLSKQDILKFNPSAIDGVRAYDTLYFPVSEFSDGESSDAVELISHEVKRGETVYGICRKYNISTQELVKHNPSVKDGVKRGDVLSIPVKLTATVKDESDQKDDVADKKSQRTQLIEDLESDGGLNRVKPPQIDHVNAVVEEIIEVESIDSIYTNDSISPLDIAVMLPFMLDDAKPGRQAQLFTEFYKGLLVALNNAPENAPINIKAYDTADSLARVKTLLERDEMAQMDIIITPNNSQQINLIDQFCKENDCYLLNAFDVKNNCYETDSNVLQTLIPQQQMYDKAIDFFISEYANYTPVFLKNLEKVSDKAQFVRQLKSRLDAENRKYREINYNDVLTAENIARLDSTKSYVFVPLSASRSDLSDIMYMLNAFYESCPDSSSVRLFGYPEWVTFQGAIKEKLHKLNTSIYSRFSYGVESPVKEELDREFERWYGEKMMQAIPQQGLLGYDIMMYILNSIYENDGNFVPENKYEGVQDAFYFEHINGAVGYCNNVIYIINYQPDGGTVAIKN